MTIDEALERMHEFYCAHNLVDDDPRAILNDFARANWEAAADALGEAEICDPIADKVRPQRARTVAYDILVLVHDAITTEAERRFPTRIAPGDPGYAKAKRSPRPIRHRLGR